MKIIARLCVPPLALLSALVYAGIVEKPIHTNFRDSPEKNFVLGYVQFGTLPNGANAVQSISKVKVRFYTRDATATYEIYHVNELDCSSGFNQNIGMGTLERASVFQDPPRGGSVKEMNPKDLPVYREVCTSVGIQPSW